METAKPDPSLGVLIRELIREVSLLLHQEVQLAKTEMSEKAALMGRSLGALAFAGAIALLGGLALLGAIITGLGALLDTFLPTGVAVWLSPLLVGAILTFYGYSRIQTALATLRHEGVMPKQTTQTLQENTQWIKAKVS